MVRDEFDELERGTPFVENFNGGHRSECFETLRDVPPVNSHHILHRARIHQDSIGTDAACRCGCGLRMRQAACVLFDSMCAVRFICIFRRRLVCKWRRIGPCCSDWTMFYKMSCNRLRMKIITHAEEDETNTMLLVGRLIGSHREVGGRKGEREVGREGGRKGGMKGGR